MRRSRKPARVLLLVPLLGLIFWVTALLSSTIPGLLVLGVNVHGLSTASYAGDSRVALAPLSQRIIDDVNRVGGRSVAPGPTPRSATTVTQPPATTPKPTPAGTASAVASASPTPKPKPSPTPTPAATLSVAPTPTVLPLPSPTVLPLPSPTVLPGPLPLPAPSLLPILPSLLPGVFK